METNIPQGIPLHPVGFMPAREVPEPNLPDGVVVFDPEHPPRIITNSEARLVDERDFTRLPYDPEDDESYPPGMTHVTWDRDMMRDYAEEHDFEKPPGAIKCSNFWAVPVGVW